MKKFSVIDESLGFDLRTTIPRARSRTFDGIVCNPYAVPALSQTGRRELRHLLEVNGQTLVALRTHLLPHGFGGDVDRILDAGHELAILARDISAQCITLDLGPLPAPEPALRGLAELADRHGMHFALSSSFAS